MATHKINPVLDSPQSREICRLEVAPMTQAWWIIFDFSRHINSWLAALGKRLAEQEPVIIVNQPISILGTRTWPPLKARCTWPPSPQPLCHYRPIHIPEGFLPWKKFAQKLNLRLLQRELDQLVPADRQRLVIYDSPSNDRFAGKIKEFFRLYYPLDDKTVTVDGRPIPGELEAEQRLLAKVDSVICVSEILAERLRQRAPLSVRLPIWVLSGFYDDRIFVADGDWPEPEVLRKLPRPRILVAGHISERIDWLGIVEAAQLRPHWTWVFKGSADPGMKEKISCLLGSRGVYQPPTVLPKVPAWMQHCEVRAVPYRLNSFTLASTPVKAIECLAMGLPVLSTKTPSLERYGEAIEWVDEGNGETYAHALDKMQKQLRDERGKMLRQQAVAGDSLGKRVQQIRDIVLSYNQEPPP